MFVLSFKLTLSSSCSSGKNLNSRRDSIDYDTKTNPLPNTVPEINQPPADALRQRAERAPHTVSKICSSFLEGCQYTIHAFYIHAFELRSLNLS